MSTRFVAVAALLSSLLITDLARADAVRRTRQLIIARLDYQLVQGSVEVRAGAAQTIAMLGPRTARPNLPSLERCLVNDRHPRVRTAAAAALGRLGLWRSVPVLIRALHGDRGPGVRGAALVALGGFDGSNVTAAIARALGADADRRVRALAARLLAKRRAGRRVRPAMSRELGAALVGDVDLAVRRIAARALSRPILARGAVAALSQAMSEVRDEDLAQQVAIALANVKAIDRLTVAAGSKASVARYWGVRALGALGPRLRAHPGALSRLGAALFDGQLRVRRAAAWALGRVRSRDTRLVVGLQRLLIEDADADVRRRAAMSLGCIGSARAVSALRLALGRDPAPKVRRSAAWALGQVGSPAAAAALQPGLGDKAPAVRRVVALALERL